jgi:hypothetical protein
VEYGARTGYHRRNATILGRITDMSAWPVRLCDDEPWAMAYEPWSRNPSFGPYLHIHDENTSSYCLVRQRLLILMRAIPEVVAVAVLTS